MVLVHTTLLPRFQGSFFIKKPCHSPPCPCDHPSDSSRRLIVKFARRDGAKRRLDNEVAAIQQIPRARGSNRDTSSGFLLLNPTDAVKASNTFGLVIRIQKSKQPLNACTASLSSVREVNFSNKPSSPVNACIFQTLFDP